MDQKIAFFDIDGTLINVPSGIDCPSDHTVRALNEFQKQGNLIVIATARGSLPFEAKGLEFDGYIFNDGHYICYNGETLVDEQFNTAMIDKQLEVYEKYHGRSMFYGRSGSWCSFLDDELVIKHRVMFQGTTKRPTDVNETFVASDVKAVSCCVLFDTADDLWAAYHELEDEFTMVPYDKGLIRMDVYCKGFTKGTACEYLYKKLGIDYENTYAFGDGVNDKEMIKLVKHGIAMGNAVGELKEIASEVTESVDNDGIALSFKQHFDI